MRRQQNRPSSSEAAAVDHVGLDLDREGMVEPGAELEQMRAQAREVVLRRLSHAPRTRAQLADSLRKCQIPDNVAAQVLDELTDVDLIDDAAFARAWVDGRSHSRGLSRSRLRRELLDRGIDIDLAENAVSGLDSASDEQTARALAEQWSNRRPLLTDNDRSRLVGYLVRRGYSPGLAARIARQGERDE
mgnify:CR=1 FL=1